MIKQGRLTFLDSLRGLAAVYVVIYHVLAMPSPSLIAGPYLKPLLEAGGSGVALFFVISAFSLCYTMPRHAATGAPVASFYIHRFFRIAPLFFVWLAFSVWRDGRAGHAGHSFAEILANMTFTFNLFPGWKEGIVWASWAIGVEMLFYAVFPMIFGIVQATFSAVVLAILAIGLTSIVTSGWLGLDSPAVTGSFGLLRHLPVFTLGIVGYYLYRQGEMKPVMFARSAGLYFLVIWAVLFLALPFILTFVAISATWSWILYGFAYLALLLGMAKYPVGLVVNRTTAYLGKVSYSLYLAHPVVIAILVPTFHAIQRGVPDTTVSYLMCAALTLMISLPIAHLTHRYIEVPGIAIGQRIAERRARLLLCSSEG
ncbi:acyltransferase family protein [Dyella tabacisoli]|uniref:Acyltransferase n=1 Tax=Dyella tabacisoli TaxID=2282381 RepID=A0A369UP77_9GAMM|nr:acyltransferase [Dyella tabacisoli]RDD82133.1 acyltransferase [Dyella tabacisoli]